MKRAKVFDAAAAALAFNGWRSVLRPMASDAREPYRVEGEFLSGLPADAVRLSQAWKGRGCADCRQTGYRGRILLFEMIQMSPVLKSLVLRKASAAEFHQEALKDDMETMLQDGMRKVAEGQTTLEEVLRVVGGPD